MLIAAKKLYRCVIEGTDKIVGSVKDLMFDDRQWTIRYFDIDTGNWLPGRRVILSPAVIESVEYTDNRVHALLTSRQIEESPAVETDLPVTRQKESELAKFYAWTPYWTYFERTEEQQGDPNLRTTRNVAGYYIGATDGEIGHVEDFIVDDQEWQIRYLVVNTRNWIPGRSVLIPPEWATSIRWEDRHVQMDLTRETIKESPAYDPEMPINRQYEENFYDFYGRPSYWTPAGTKV